MSEQSKRSPICIQRATAAGLSRQDCASHYTPNLDFWQQDVLLQKFFQGVFFLPSDYWQTISYVSYERGEFNQNFTNLQLTTLKI